MGAVCLQHQQDEQEGRGVVSLPLSHAVPDGKPLIPTLGAGTMQLNQSDRKQAAITVCSYICWVPLH